jgi:hypothetical protein
MWSKRVLTDFAANNKNEKSAKTLVKSRDLTLFVLVEVKHCVICRVRPTNSKQDLVCVAYIKDWNE